VLRVIEDLRGAAAFHDLAAVEHDGLVGELTHHGQVVADQDVRDGRLVADVGQEVEHLRLDRDIQCGDRFVEDQDGGLSRQRPGDRHPLPLTAR
jgi:hypothetical protein